MKPDRQALRTLAKQTRTAMARQLAAHPLVAAQRAAAHRRWRRRGLRALVATALGLLLLLWRCPQGPAPAPVSVQPPPPPASSATSPPAAATAARILRQRRPSLQIDPPTPPTWLDALRLQVLARGPRLAKCFAHGSLPTTLRWSAALIPASGIATDQAFEPVSGQRTLDAPDHACLAHVLSQPPFHFSAAALPAHSSTPVRISIIIEF